MRFFATKNKSISALLSISAGILFSNQVFSLEVKVGVLMPTTGSQAFYGKEASNGIDLAMQEFHDPNLKIKLIPQDTESKPLGAANGMNLLITSSKVSAVIAEVISSNAIAAASISEKAKVPILSPAATNDSVTKDKKYVFRTCFIDSFQGVALANYAINNLQAKSAIILEDSDSDYSKGLSENFKKTFENEGGKIEKTLYYSQKDTSFISQLGYVRKINPNVLFIPGFHQQVGVILREAKDLAIDAKKLGGDGWFTPELRSIAKGAEIGGFISTHYSTDSNDPKVKAFIKAYEKKYKSKPSAHAALGYDSFLILAQAIKNANSGDREKITDALSKIKDFPGITGSITMDENHNPIKPAVILEYVKNGYEYKASINPSKN